MINNLITYLKEETSEDAEHKIWCDTELTTNARPQLKVSMENAVTEVAEPSAQVSRLREEVSNADLICYEVTATNEEAIKDVQDAQSNLTQAIQILMDFFAKAGQAVYLTQQSLLSEARAIEGFTMEIRWEVPISLAPNK